VEKCSHIHLQMHHYLALRNVSVYDRKVNPLLTDLNQNTYNT